MNRSMRLSLVPLTLTLAATLMACGGTQVDAKGPGLTAQRRADGTVDDRSLCELKGKPEREALTARRRGLAR